MSTDYTALKVELGEITEFDIGSLVEVIHPGKVVSIETTSNSRVAVNSFVLGHFYAEETDIDDMTQTFGLAFNYHNPQGDSQSICFLIKAYYSGEVLRINSTQEENVERLVIKAYPTIAPIPLSLPTEGNLTHDN